VQSLSGVTAASVENKVRAKFDFSVASQAANATLARRRKVATESDAKGASDKRSIERGSEIL
jgi:hypothetical protein